MLFCATFYVNIVIDITIGTWAMVS